MIQELLNPSIYKIRQEIKLIEIIDRYGRVMQTMTPTRSFDYLDHGKLLYKKLLNKGYYIRFCLEKTKLLLIKDGENYVFCAKKGIFTGAWVKSYQENWYKNGNTKNKIA